MTKDQPFETNQKILELFEELRGVEFRDAKDLAEYLQNKNINFQGRDLREFNHILTSRFGRLSGTHHIPTWLLDLFAEIAGDHTNGVCCDPWAGIGLLAGTISEITQAQSVIALTQNQGDYALGKILVPHAEWQLGDPLLLLQSLKQDFDVVASVLPMGARSPGPLRTKLAAGHEVELKDDLGNLILVAASMRLRASGVGLFVVPPSFFSKQKSIFHRFAELGLGIDAAFALPSGTFAPYTNIPSYLVVVRRTRLTRMFVAQLSAETNTNFQIISNFRQGLEGGSVELGRIVDPDTFKGIEQLRAAESIAAAEERFGVTALNLEELGDLKLGMRLGRPSPEFVFDSMPNAIYVPLIGNSDVKESVDDLTLKPQNYAQIAINPTRSIASFVARFLNSEFGRELREQSKAGLIPKLNTQSLRALRILVPDLQTQLRVLEVESRITAEQNTIMALQSEIAEMRSELWSNPRSSSSIDLRVSQLSERLAGGISQHASATLDQWFETLPFPLASILRAWQATPSQDYSKKYQHLLHFFEATAEFLSVILLSAFSSNPATFAPHRQKLVQTLKNQNLSFNRATFGTWKLVVEYFGKQTRDLLNEKNNSPDKRALCAEMFVDPSLTLPQALSRKELSTILSVTNKMRNDWGGHGGVVGEKEAESRNQQLLSEVQNLRLALADTWAEIQMIHALHCVPRRGVFQNEVALLMGSNNEFLKETRSMTTWLDVETLYLSKKDSGRVLKLLPLIQVGPSPESAKNACYFFNRIERDGARFVSYHFAETPELKDQFAEATEAIRFLVEE